MTNPILRFMFLFRGEPLKMTRPVTCMLRWARPPIMLSIVVLPAQGTGKMP